MIGRVWALHVDHHLLPTIESRRLHGDSLLFGWPPPRPEAGEALLLPSPDVIFHALPPHEWLHGSQGLVGASMSAQKTSMTLEENPPLPANVSASVTLRHNWDPTGLLVV